MKAIILARVSTEEQKEAGNSLPAQIARMERYCIREKFDIIKKYSFDESAYKTKRDEFDKILDYLNSTKEKVAVCFDKVDRLSRNVFDKRVSALYEKAVADEIELHFVSDGQVINTQMSAVDKFNFGISLGLAKYYSDAISDNVKRAFEKKIRAGEITKKAPIGYINAEDENEKKIAKPDPERSHLVTEVFELYATGNYSMEKVSIVMKKKGLRSNTPKRTILKVRGIEAILKNPFYYGEQMYKGKTYPHIYPPLIDKLLFDKCTEVRGRHNTSPSKDTKRPYVLRGLIKCAKCGCAITPEIKKKKYIYYSCTNYKKICKRKWIQEKELLKPIKEVLDNIKLTQERIDDLTEVLKETEEYKNEFHEKELDRLRKNYDKIENRISVMYEDRLDGRITTDEYDQNVKDFKEKQEDLLYQMKQYDKASEKYYLTANKVLSLAQRASEIFESSEAEEKRQLLNYLLQNCKLNGIKLEFKLKTPFDTVLLANTHHEWGG